MMYHREKKKEGRVLNMQASAMRGCGQAQSRDGRDNDR